MKKFYTMNQVKKHNKRNDAWVVYKGNVYDITKWIFRHPGGNIIMKGVGKNIDSLFKQYHTHSSYAKNTMKKYFIGKLKKEIKKTKKYNRNKLRKTKRLSTIYRSKKKMRKY